MSYPHKCRFHSRLSQHWNNALQHFIYRITLLIVHATLTFTHESLVRIHRDLVVAKISYICRARDTIESIDCPSLWGLLQHVHLQRSFSGVDTKCRFPNGRFQHSQLWTELGITDVAKKVSNRVLQNAMQFSKGECTCQGPSIIAWQQQKSENSRILSMALL
jgi:hypothetical protein